MNYYLHFVVVECSNTNVNCTLMTVQAHQMSSSVRQVSPSVQLWMGETGGAYDSGCRGSTNTFMSGFWYLNSMGAFAVQGHDMFCRQTLTGGNYELVNKVTNVPNPDYYSTLLFGQLMGKKVLDVSVEMAPSMRVFAHCTPELDVVFGDTSVSNGSVTLLFLNYDEEDVVVDDTDLRNNSLLRWEYILTGVYNSESHAADALHSDLVALNGELLVPHPASGDIPTLSPRVVHFTAAGELRRLRLPGHSYGYVVYPQAGFQGCL